MAAFLNRFNAVLDEKLNENNKFNAYLDLVANTINVKKQYLIKGFLVLFALYMILGHFAALICNLVGFVYPSYASILALETPQPDDDKKWLTYWVVYAFFSVLEFFSDIIFSWFPLYWLAKVFFLVWCFFPIANNGSIIIYNRFILPFFLKNKDKFSGTINKAVDTVMEKVDKVSASLSKED